MSESNVGKRGKEKNKAANNKNEGNPKGNKVGVAVENQATSPFENNPSKLPKEPCINIREPEGPTKAWEQKVQTQKQPNKPEKQKNQSKCNKCEAYLTEMNSYKNKVLKMEVALQKKSEDLTYVEKESEEKGLKLQEKTLQYEILMRKLVAAERELKDRRGCEIFEGEMEYTEQKLKEETLTCGYFNVEQKLLPVLSNLVNGNKQTPAETLQEQQRSQNVYKTQSLNRSPLNHPCPENIPEDTSQKNVESMDSWDNVAGAPLEVEPTQAANFTGKSEWHNQNAGRGTYNVSTNRSFRGWSGPNQTPRYTEQDPSRVVREINGDLFSVTSDVSLAHCVAEDLGMSSGVAVDFRYRFKRVGELLEQRRGVGQVAILQVEGRYIYYMITKTYSNSKPIMRDVVTALEVMRNHAVQFKVTKLAMPKIGCGLDRLDWRQVKPAIARTFENTGIQITVYNFQPENSQPPKQNVHVTHVQYPLFNISHDTGLIFFGSADGRIADTSLFPKYKINFEEFSRGQRKVGDVVRITPPGGDYLYCLVVGEKMGDRLSYTHLEQCMHNLRIMVMKDRYDFIGLEAFLDREDELTMEKVVNIMRNGIKPSLKYNISIYVCWPEQIRKYHNFEIEKKSENN